MTTETKREFATPFAMKCNQQQFESVKDGLEKMGYEVSEINWFSMYPYLANDYLGNNRRISNVLALNANHPSRIVIETFNPDLCLALAAMSKGDTVFEGEWFYADCCGLVGKYAKELVGKSANETSKLHPKATADQLIEHFTKKASDYIPKSGVAEGFNSKICGGEWVRIDELSKLPEDEDAKIGKRYLDRDGNIVECVKNVCHTSTCVPCFFKHNDKNCITVSCHKEDRKDKEYVAFKLVKKSEIPTSTPKTITFSSWKEMAKFLIDRELYTIRGRRYFSNSASLELRFYVQYPSGKPQELTNGWLDYNQTFYLSDPTVKPEITITYDEARHLIAQMKQVEFEQIAIK